jgi:hypothetical protein
MFAWLKRWLRVADEYPKAYVGPVSNDESLSALDELFHEAYQKVVTELELAEVTHDGIAVSAALDAFRKTTGREVMDYGVNVIDVTTITSTSRMLIGQGYIAFAPTREEVAW